MNPNATVKPASSPEAAREPTLGLALVQDFINTLHMDIRERDDAIATPEALERWLSERKLLKERRHLSEADVVHACSVREALRDLLAANEGTKVAKGAVDTLSRAARSAQLLVAFEPDGEAALRPAASGIDAALGELLAITFRSITDGSWQRLKACHDDGCRWAFYDRSKNRSGNWCSMASCGNRAKARTFREHKHKAR
jgi:predicted RNA-binding Zn ribbon-like protein